MPVFTVHMPFAGTGDSAAAEKSVFVRDGFHFWAFVFGPLWLLVHRLWLATVIYLIVLAGLEVALSVLHVPTDIRLLVMVLIGLLMGFEAASVWRWSFSRGRWHEVGLVVANDRESAERRFFDAWVARQPVAGGSSAAPPPSLPLPPAPTDIGGLQPAN